MPEPTTFQNVASNASSSLYEIVVYFGSTSLAVILASVSLLKTTVISDAAIWIATLGAAQQVILLIVSATVAYVYGQLASTLSSTIIGRQIRHMSSLLPEKYVADYRYDFSDAVEQIGVKDRLPPSKVNNKWTLLFFIRTKHPDISRDLSKRQMRERLARINALNMLVLLFTSISHIIIVRNGYQVTSNSIWKESIPLYWPVVFGVLSFLFSYEFFKRACWNNDLIVKFLPVINR